MAALALLSDEPWGTMLVRLAIVVEVAAVAALVDSVCFRSRRCGRTTGRPFAAGPWPLARTSDGTEMAFKLTHADDVLTRHIEHMGHLRVPGGPNIGSPYLDRHPGRLC